MLCYFIRVALYTFLILVCQKCPFEDALVQLSKSVLEIPGIEYVLPFDNLIVRILLGRLYVKSVIQVDSTGFSFNISVARIVYSIISILFIFRIVNHFNRRCIISVSYKMFWIPIYDSFRNIIC